MQNSDTSLLCVASHNVMQGLFIEELIPVYCLLAETQKLDILCIQENRESTNNTLAGVIAQSLGEEFRIIEDRFDNAIIYRSGPLILTGYSSIPLPRLKRLSRFERLWSQEREPSQRSALLATFRPQDGGPFAVVSFHLDAAGNTKHRRRQVNAIADAIIRRRFAHRFIACGDTNAVAKSLSRTAQLSTLKRVLFPLAALGADDPETEPTHWFARMHEPGFLHRLCVILGKIGIDLPQRYDVIVTNMRDRFRGQMRTPQSDHDLVWATIDLS